MKTRALRTGVLSGPAAGLLLTLFFAKAAQALVTDSPLAPPPSNPPCTAASAKVVPGLNGNQYSITGRCYINLAQDKTDLDHPVWIISQVSVVGSYNTSNQGMSETLTFSTPSGPITINNNAWCEGDPWITRQDCTLNVYGLRNSVEQAVGLDPGQMTGDRGPLSLIVLSPEILEPLISKQESKPPRPPVKVDPVVWPVDNGKSTRVAVTWSAGNMAHNRWVMQFNVQYAKAKTDADSAYSNAGQVLGLGPKPRFDASDLGRVYTYMLQNELSPIGSYYFRVCASNDADTQCSEPVQARQPTKMELISHSGIPRVVTAALVASREGGKPGAGGVERSRPVALGTARPGISTGAGGGNPTGGDSKPNGPIALGTARPGGPAGTGSVTPAGGSAPTGVGLAHPSAPTALGTGRPGGSSGASAPSAIGMAKPIGPVAFGAARPGGSTGVSGETPAGTTGPAGIGLARPFAPTALGTGRPGVSSGGGANSPSAIGMARPIGPVAGVAAPGVGTGGAGPGMVAIPDLAVGRGMRVHDQMIPWGGSANLALRANAARQCPLPMSFQYMNVGKGPATNVIAVIRDSAQPMQPVATQTLSSLIAGQSSTVGGVLRVGAQAAPRRIIVVARVHEAGKMHETDIANDRGSITVNVTCK